MNIPETERYRKAVIESAPKWVQGESTISNVEELSIIADHYKVNMPTYTHHFLYSRNPNNLAATGAWKALSNFLTRLAKKIQEVENVKDSAGGNC